MPIALNRHMTMSNIYAGLNKRSQEQSDFLEKAPHISATRHRQSGGGGLRYKPCGRRCLLKGQSMPNSYRALEKYRVGWVRGYFDQGRGLTNEPLRQEDLDNVLLTMWEGVGSSGFPIPNRSRLHPHGGL